MHEKNVPNNVVHLNALKSCGCHAFILILWIKNSKNIKIKNLKSYLFMLAIFDLLFNLKTANSFKQSKAKYNTLSNLLN